MMVATLTHYWALYRQLLFTLLTRLGVVCCSEMQVKSKRQITELNGLSAGTLLEWCQAWPSPKHMQFSLSFIRTRDWSGGNRANLL